MQSQMPISSKPTEQTEAEFSFVTDSDFFVEKVDCRAVPGFAGHELVAACTDRKSGLRAFVAIHNTKLGVALGGCRMWHYASEAEALTDALRLSQGMSYKHAVAGTNQGGGKAVIHDNSRRDKTESLFRAFGRFVDSLGGRYITAKDVGSSVEDMVVVRQHTDHVAGLPTEMGGSGDPSPLTAYGVFCGIQAAVAFRQTRRYDPQDNLKGLTAAVQGLGNVGFSLCSHLHDAGAKLIVADISESSVQRACDQFNATPVDPDSIYSADADVFVPSALGGILNSDTVSQLKATMVVGAANNQLAEPSVAKLLTDREILYAPDYVTNAGGIINISLEEGGYDHQKALSLTEQIGSTLTEVFERARLAQKTTAEIADFMARRLLNKTSD